MAGNGECKNGDVSTIHASVAVFGLESAAADRILPRAGIVSCLRSVLPLGPGDTSRIQRMVRSAAQEDMARTQSLHDTRLADGASLEPTDAS